jgi:hypothetical protein
VKGRHPRSGALIPLSRPGVRFNDVEAAVSPGRWPWHTPNAIDLAAIQARIHAASLD